MQPAIGLLILASTIWVGVDTSKRDWRGRRFCNATWKWVLGALVLWIVVFPSYLLQRSKAPKTT